MTGIAPVPSKNPEKPVERIPVEQQKTIAADWFKSVIKIDYLVKSKKREYKIENIDGYVESELAELIEFFPEQNELIQRHAEVRKRQQHAPHRDDVIYGKCIAIDDQDKIVLIYFWNEELPFGANTGEPNLKLEVDFLLLI